MRTGVGHRVIALGLGLRRASVPLGLVFFALFIGQSLLGQSGAPTEPLSMLLGGHHSAALALIILECFGIAVAAVLAGRLIAMTTGAIGWCMLPRTHRELLSRVIDGPKGPALQADTRQQFVQVP